MFWLPVWSHCLRAEGSDPVAAKLVPDYTTPRFQEIQHFVNVYIF